MKKILTFLFSVLVYSAMSASPVDSLKFVNATDFPMLGKAFSKTDTPYRRLPSYLKDSIREELWYLGKNTSGLAIRFKTNSKNIGAKWMVTNNFAMNHMTSVGIKGLDLYRYENGAWCGVNAGLPTGKENKAMIGRNMDGAMREYMLYLPLYDGIESLEIGIDSTATITLPQLNTPRKENPVLFYGTSITQGGCASRPGMSYTSILSRRFDRQFINLGFSGNGRFDLEVARAIATSGVQPSIIVIDCLPNCTVDIIKARGIAFIEILRGAFPTTPILVVENIRHSNARFDLKTASDLIDKDVAIAKVVKHFTDKGDKNLHLMKAEGMVDLEGTVDGAHLTDFGFVSIAEAYYKELSRFIK